MFILALDAVRFGLRGVVANLAGAPMISAVTAANGLIVLAGAMMIVQTVEMWLRARRLLTEAERRRRRRAESQQEACPDNKI